MEIDMKTLTREYLELKTKNTSLNKEIDGNKSRMYEIEQDFKHYLMESGLEEVKTEFGKFKMIDKDTYQITDKQALIDWCAQAGRADVVQSRVNSAVLREMLKEDNMLPEGLKMNVVQLARFGTVRK